MKRAIHHMAVVRYFLDGRPWDVVQVIEPAWEEVEHAIRRMDNVSLPLVQLNPTADEENEDVFNVLGGDGRWALFQIMGSWHFENPEGGEEEVTLWESDQGYSCKARNILTDIEAVLRITRQFYRTGSYEGLSEVG